MGSSTHAQSKGGSATPPSSQEPQLQTRPFEEGPSLPIQAQLTVGQPGDPYEQEADRVADQVMAMPDPTAQTSVQRQGAADDELQMRPLTAESQLQRQNLTEEEDAVQRKPLEISSIQRDSLPQEKDSPQKSASTTTPEAASAELESRLHSSKGGGSPLPESTRKFIEPRMGFDFSQVQVHTDSTAVQMNEQLGARAFTHGSDIYFGAGQYAPESDSGQRLLAHELTHVVQQTGLSGQVLQSKLIPSQPGDASEREADAIADQVLAGQQANIFQTTSANLHGDWLDDALSTVDSAASSVGNAVGDALGVRQNEEAWDAWEDYQDALTELTEFQAESPYSVPSFQPSTGLGMFDAQYSPATGILTIVCKCKFNFIDGSASEFPEAAAADLTWTQPQKDDWQARYLSTVSSAWSSASHVFYCQKDWWEALSARTVSSFIAVESDEHFKLDITKIPSGAFRGSSVRAPMLGGAVSGYGDFDSEDLTPTRKPGGTQVGAVHEAGHMLGLGDEYNEGPIADLFEPDHSDLVEEEFGHEVERGSDTRIMSGGMDIQPEHGVTFLEALKEATSMEEWSFTQKAAKEVPPNPAFLDAGDFPAPDSDTVPT